MQPTTNTNINTGLFQRQTLSPQVQQALKVLHMNSSELLAHIHRQALENPAIELEDDYAEPDRYREMLKKLEWLSSVDARGRVHFWESQQNDDEVTVPSLDDETLQTTLLHQLHMQKLSPAVSRAAEYIIQSLDGRGYLELSIEQLSELCGVGRPYMAKALGIVQDMEPWGVGARNLRECLLIQLKKKGISDSDVQKVVVSFLEELSRNKLAAIASGLGIPMEKVKSISATLRALNPGPGSHYGTGGPVPYITPDVIAVSSGRELEIVVNDSIYPSINISPVYKELLNTSSDTAVREFIGGRLEQALLLKKSLHQRNRTLLEVAGAIVDIQRDFMRKGPGHLVPMLLNHVASRLGLHESTVSRAVSGKYLQCCWGTFALKYFFSNAVGRTGDNANTPASIKLRIKKMIETENRKKPLSDQKIAEVLSSAGVVISRRTVAKYREELKIPSTSRRREF